MRKKSLLLLLLASCAQAQNTEEVLVARATAPLEASCLEVDKSYDSKEVCLGRYKCTLGSSLLSETFHFCICPDTGCICFATFTKKSYEECIGDPENCGGHSSLIFISPSFCKLPKEERSKAFQQGLSDVIKSDETVR